MKAWRILWMSGLLVLLTLLAGALGPSPAGAGNFQVTQLTNNSYDDYDPQIDSGQVVWWGGPSYSEIYYCDVSNPPATPQNISNNPEISKVRPQIDNGQVVWQGDWEIYYYDLSTPPATPPNLSNNPDTYDSRQQIDNGQVVWQGDDLSDSEIYYCDVSTLPFTPQNISNKSYDDYDPQIDNGQVVWKGDDGSNWEIYYYDLSNPPATPQNISNNPFDERNPQIDNGQVVWEGEGGEGGTSEIYYYDLSWGPGTSPLQLTNNSYDDYDPQIHNGQVVWYGFGGPSRGPSPTSEIYYYDLSWTPGTDPQQLTDNYYDDKFPQIDNGLVVWEGWDGEGGTSEIYYYDLPWAPGKSPLQITNNPYNDKSPQIDSGQVVWEGEGGPDGTSEIYLASPLMFYQFTCYYPWDYYVGCFYDFQYYEIGDRIMAFTDENRRQGYYEITGRTTARDGVDGLVFVDTYYDAESDNFYTPVHAGSAIGEDGLGSERDYLLLNGYVLNRFGIGPEGAEEVHYEADVTRAQNVYNRHREPFRTIRLRSLHRCYLLRARRHPELFDDYL